MISIRARTVAIIGAGPSGLVAAKYLRAEKAFDEVVIFEQRASSGGIWNYTPHHTNEDLFHIPQTNPRGLNQEPAWIHKANGCNGENKAVSFLSPIYERLETNIPRGLMGFQDLDWPPECQLFPEHGVVLDYIKDYGKEFQSLIRYETQVVNVEPADESPVGSWRVKTRDLRSNKTHQHVYDAVIVANGHFIVPNIPNIADIQEWNNRYPDTISHSKYFRTPEVYAQKKVVVPLIWSSKSTSMLKPAPDPKKKEVPPISRFIPETRSVQFEDGTVETDVDAIVFATGYFYSLPFLQDVRPELITDGSHVLHTYRHLFYSPRPTLSFLALNQRVIPFPICEAQSAVLGRVYSGRLSLPAYSDMNEWEKSTVAEMGNGKNFHLLPFPKDGIYINELSKWASEATLREGLDNGGKGKTGPVWGEWEFWCRENFPAIRAAFGAQGNIRHSIKSLEELGFDYKEIVKRGGSGESKLI
ncbi:FAD/NAD(P)-binding domain-containing protein [Polyplosphaeria fusca]|uniref:FAD/NAD(P)-binding domain-containing protein n=1 Tax=Polyplosphaeria fusca TaxID=682080 RepID=A0A9P4QSX4_9PLEO|nr:FAD/NAD(P)-binding domain-containing protein [Polyplosphaeria fusca]